jgi:arylsulfatase
MKTPTGFITNKEVDMKKILFSIFAIFVLIIALTESGSAQDKPNILVIWGDDIGITNISAYSRGLMGYQTPNIDRIANEGVLFTDYYAEQSCTAGRASFITGQIPFRVGLSKVGLPGAKQGLSDKDPTLAELLMDYGYTSGQFGKNHLGDRNEYLPTVHGFDEYAGVLYHLNALEEPEDVDYPQDPEFFANMGPRDAIHSWATDKHDPTEDPRFGVVGKQRIESMGPVTTKRMETYDDETIAQSLDFMRRAVKDDKPFFIWHNTSRCHLWTHLRKKYAEMVPEKGLMGAAMTEFDDGIGILLDELDKLGITENTIVIISTDNGPMKQTWPDAGTSPFGGQKGTTWEGGFRVPAVVRWPGVIEPGTVINDIFHHMDWIPTILAALGEPDVKEKLLTGYEAAGKTFKVHLDGYNQLPLLKGEGPGSRHEIHYITDEGDYAAFRYKKWKISFLTQEHNGFDVWDAPYTYHRAPRICDLRADPFEFAQQANASWAWQQWMFRHCYIFIPAQGYVGKFIKSFKEFPPRSLPASFSVGDALKMISAPQTH